MEPSARVRSYFSTGRIARANRQWKVEKMAAALGMGERKVVQEYGWPDAEQPSPIVYLIGSSDRPQDGDPVRIGWTGDIVQRLETLQPGSVLPLQLVAYFPGGAVAEAEIHAAIERHRIRGDWFRMCEDVRREFGARIELAAGAAA